MPRHALFLAPKEDGLVPEVASLVGVEAYEITALSKREIKLSVSAKKDVYARFACPRCAENVNPISHKGKCHPIVLDGERTGAQGASDP